MPVHRLTPGAVLRLGLGAPQPGRSWTRTGGMGVPVGPESQLARLGYYAGSALAAIPLSSQSQASMAQSLQLLTPDQRDLIYQRCPDVRAAIDGIVRRVATHDWEVGPTIEADDPRYEGAVEACVPVQRWLSITTSDLLTWQELLTAFCTDLLKQDAGAMERVRNGGGELAELVPLRGPDVHPIRGADGRLEKYTQLPTSGVGWGFVPGQARDLPVDDVLYMSLFTNTLSAEGMPLLDALVYETIAVLRAAEYWARSVDLNEVPPGIAVITGVSREAEDRMRAEYERDQAKDWRMRFLFSQSPGETDAKWVEFRRLPRELQLVELTSELRRAIWRVFGVTPVEMGETEGMPRATAQVQLDVSGSHLISPILELLQAKVNALVIPDLVDPQFLELVEFRFTEHKELTPAERLDRARELQVLVDSGILTRDEAREVLGYEPHPEDVGSVPLITASTTIRLVDAVAEPEPVPDPLADPAAAETADDAQAEDDAAEDDGPGPSQTEDNAAAAASRPADAPGPKPARMPTRRAPLRIASIRSVGDGEAPAAWTGPLAGLRTLSLTPLWEQLVAYRRAVDPWWEEARAECVAAVAAEHKPGGFDAAARARAIGRVNAAVDALATKWGVGTLPHYRSVAESARVRAADWTGASLPPAAARQRADAYASRAMRYLQEEGGLLSDVRARVVAVVVGAGSRTRDRRWWVSPQHRAGVDLDSTTAQVMAAVGAAWDALHSRVDNWAGRLLELAHDVLSEDLAATGTTTDETGAQAAAEWWVEWVSVSDARTCQTCRTYGSSGFIRLSDLHTVPGGATECRARCRCVLVYWLKSEIDDGSAKQFSPGNTGRPL